MIWVIGGTKDSRDFLEKITKYRDDIVVTTATEYGGKLVSNLENIKVICKKLNLDEMRNFVKAYNINVIVDLSHPYAAEVSSNAINISKEHNINYYRFEREELKLIPHKYIEFENIIDLLNYVKNIKDNILVTLGSNNIPYFKDISNLEKCYFRILPKWEIIKMCEENGVLPKNIIAMQGPFSKEMNKEMIKQLNIKYMITKQSGNTGGEKEKIDAANEMDVEIIYLTRPKINYDNKYDNIDELVNIVKNIN